LMNSVPVIILLIIINVAAVYMLDAAREDRIVPMLADSVTGFMIEYSAASVALLAIKHFTVSRALTAAFMLNIILLLLVYLLLKKRPQVHKGRPVPGIDLISGMIIVIGGAAITYKAGITLTPFHQDYYLYHGMSLMNYGRDYIAENCGKIDFYYGLPAYPALMAIGGAVGGIGALLNINTIMTLAIGVYVTLIADRMKLKGICKYAAVAIIMLSPLMVETGKTASCMVFVMLLIVAAIRESLEFIHETNTRKIKQVAGTLLPVTAAVVCIMITSAKSVFFLPLIIALFAIVYAYTDRIQALIMGSVAALCQLILVLACDEFYPNVFNHEWWSWISTAGHDDFYGEAVAIFASAGWLLISLLLLLPAGRRTVSGIFSDNSYIKGIGLFGAGLIVLSAGKIFFNYDPETSSEFITESFLATCIYSGVILIPGAFIYLLIRKRKLPVPPYLAILATTSVYGLFVICSSEVPFITYERLQLSQTIPFIACAVLIGAAALQELTSDLRKQIAVYAIAALIMLPMTIFAMIYRPETSMDAKALEEIASVTDKGHNAILIDEDANALHFAIRLTSHADVFLANEGLPAGYENYYILTYDPEACDELVCEFTAANSSYRADGTPREDFFAYYPVIGAKKISDARTIYLGKIN